MALVKSLVIVAGSALLVALAAAGLIAPAGTHGQADLEDLLRQYHDTLNGGDVAGAVAFFTEDGVFESTEKTFSGKDALQNLFTNQVSQDRRVDIVSSELSDDTVSARVEVRAKRIQACGAARTVATETVSFSGDKISRLVFQIDLSDPDTAKAHACQLGPALPSTGGLPTAAGGTALTFALPLGVALILGSAVVWAVALKRST